MRKAVVCVGGVADVQPEWNVRGMVRESSLRCVGLNEGAAVCERA